MDMTGERRIPAPREKVWNALNDPQVLKASIPGCETLEKVSDTEYRATAAVKIGPIAARFTGKVQLSDIDPPSGYTISGEGQGGVAGFAKGGAAVRLADAADGTLLTYEVKAQVGGKIAQLGARLVDASARSMAEQFFTRFVAEVGGAPQEVGASGMAGAIAAVGNAVSGAAAAVAPASAAPPPAPPPAALPVTMPVRAAGAAPLPPAAPVVAPARISLFALVPREPMGFPLVAWVGSVICLGILVLIFGSYLW
ncbi:MAG: carbon monoxide dehydrogenase subunit G [Acidisphaera sp.]|nr:carbon monoxide dehydrogenase subunit G [Acidisphaera sp.]